MSSDSVQIDSSSLHLDSDSEAIQRLGLCRAGFAPPPRSRRPQSAKTLFWHGLSDSPAMSPLAHHTRPHRSPTPDRSCLTSHSRPDRLTTCTATTRAGSQRLLVFRYDTNGGAPLQNPKTLSLPVAIRYRPRCRRCEPLFLAATSPSTIATTLRIRALSQSACVNRLSIVRLAAPRQGRANDGLHLDCARSANGFGF
jgi:hypothetical protein